MSDNRPPIITEDFEKNLDDIFVHPPRKPPEFDLLYAQLRSSIDSEVRLTHAEAQRLANLIDGRANINDHKNRTASGAYSTLMAQKSAHRLEALTAASMLARGGYKVTFSDPDAQKIQQRDFTEKDSNDVSHIENLNSNRSSSAPVPKSIIKKYQMVGTSFYFAHQPDQVAFEVVDDKIKTIHNSAVVAKDMIDFAKSKGWDTLRVSGNASFKQIVWIESQLKGIDVKGYKPNDADFSLLQKRRKEANTKQLSTSNRPVELSADKADRSSGVLVTHGADNYKHDPTKSMSYFVTLTNSDGKNHTIWGKELRSAIADSSANLGDKIKLINLGKAKVEVDQLDDRGQPTGEKLITYRNEWEVKAESVRRDSPRQIIEKHPDLLSSAAAIALASKFSEQIPGESDKQRFNTIAREKLAQRIERGEPVATIGIKEKRAKAQGRDQELK